jgi:hypothetical protein
VLTGPHPVPPGPKWKHDDRVTGHNSAASAQNLTRKLVARKALVDAGYEDQLNIHEKALLAHHQGQNTPVPKDMINGSTGALGLAICHKTSSEYGQEVVVNAANSGNWSTLDTFVEQFKPVGWMPVADPAKPIPANALKAYQEYNQAAQANYDAAKAKLAEIKKSAAVTLADLANFTDLTINSPTNFFVGLQRINASVSMDQDRNAPTDDNSGAYPDVPSTPESQQHEDYFVPGQKAVSPSEGLTAGKKTIQYQEALGITSTRSLRSAGKTTTISSKKRKAAPLPVQQPTTAAPQPISTAQPPSKKARTATYVPLAPVVSVQQPLPQQTFPAPIQAAQLLLPPYRNQLPQYPSPLMHYQNQFMHYQAPAMNQNPFMQQQQSPTFQYQTPALQYQAQLIRQQAQLTQLRTPSVQHQTPPMQYQTPPVQYQTPPVQYQSPSVQYQTPVMQHQSQSAQHPPQTVQYQTPLIQQTTSTPGLPSYPQQISVNSQSYRLLFGNLPPGWPSQ